MNMELFNELWDVEVAYLKEKMDEVEKSMDTVREIIDGNYYPTDVGLLLECLNTIKWDGSISYDFVKDLNAKIVDISEILKN